MPKQTTELMKIGELKKESGVPIKTIRYYEELGLIKAERRTEGGFRLFSRAILPRLGFIKRARSLDFSLQDISSFLEIYDRGEIPCDEVKQNIQEKILEIEEKILNLEELKAQLIVMLFDTSTVSPSKEGIICPIIQQEIGA